MGILTVDDIQIFDTNSINEKQLPSVVSDKFADIIKLEDRVKEAVNKAERAKEKSKNAQVSAGIGKKKAAIELLQDAANGTADALITMADAQKLLFNYQTELTKTTKFLFGLGITNLVSTRTVIRELELKLKGASEEEISDLAKQELCNVIMQLKAQEDMMIKQTKLTKDVKAHEEKINKFKKEEQKQNEKIDKNADTLEKHKKELSEQKQKNAKYDKEISGIKKARKKQDELLRKCEQEIEQLNKKNLEFDQELEKKAKVDEEHYKLLLERKQEIERLDNKVSEYMQKNVEQDEKISETRKSINEKIGFVKEEFNNNIAEINESIDNLSALLSEEKTNTENSLYALEKTLLEKSDHALKDYNEKFGDIQTYTDNKNNDTNTEVTKLNVRTDNLEKKVIKIWWWKLGVSIVAIMSLLLNILQLLDFF